MKKGEQRDFSRWHDLVLLGKMGAGIYVLDENGTILSDGNHEVTWKGHRYFEGKSGSLDTKFKIPKDVRPLDNLENNNDTLTAPEIAERAADPRIAQFAQFLVENGNKLPKAMSNQNRNY